MAGILIIIITGIGYVVYNQFYSPKSKAINKVKSSLLDPESAKFKEVTVKDDIVCGHVNAKNSFGGYVGTQYFIVKDDKIWMMSLRKMNKLINKNIKNTDLSELEKHIRQLDEIKKRLEKCDPS